MDRILTEWHLHRRALIIGGAMVAGVLVLLLATALVIRASRGTSSSPAAQPQHHGSTDGPTAPEQQTSTAAASDVAYWNARVAIIPRTSVEYPAVAVNMRADPSAYASAFATELFTRDYLASSRDDLLAWTQYENAPLRSPSYPQVDWTKVLADSLTDPTWDDASETPVPAQAVWLALAGEHATSRVSGVSARVDPQWEQRVSDGYAPTDPLMTVWDVSLRLVQTAASGGQHSYDVSLALQLGTSPRGLYGVATTNNYVIREVN